MRLIYNKLSRLQLTGILFTTVIILVTLVISFYYKEKQLIEEKNYNTLESVAELKAEQISQWYKDRIAEATYYSTDLPLSRNASGDIRIDYSQLNTSLLKVMQDHRYENIMLIDTGGKLLFSVMEFYQHDPGAVSSVRKCLKTGNIVVNDFWYCSTHKKVHFDITAPVYSTPRGTASKGNIIALLVFRIDPRTYLYPMINVWPGQNKTAETILGRKSGNKVVLLNKPLKQSGQPMDFNITSDLLSLPIVQAVNGTRGRFMGVDFLGIKVMADLRQIQGTPWSLVVKMNVSELYRELYIKAVIVALGIVLLVLVLVVIFTRLNNQLKKEAERTNERQLASLVSHLPGFVYRCKNDQNWTTLYISERCEHVTGYGAAVFLEHFDSKYNEIIVPEYRQRVYETAQKALDANDFFELDYPIIHSSGKQTWVHERGKGVYNDDGQLLFIEGYIEDISLRREAKQALITAKEKAEESDRLKTAFLANMSHEIRTPMNGILGFLELLKETDLPAEDKNEYLNLMNISGQRLLNTINDIIEISKIESGKLESRNSDIDLTEVFQFYVDFFKHEAELKNIRLCLGRQVEAGSALITGDRHKLDGILTNLVKNAVKFTKSGTIELNSALEGDSLLMWVKDTGTGIPAHRQQAIFERFVQADTSLARNHEGSGLGLAIVKAYVDTLGGTIWVESAEGVGSTFFVRIPYLKGRGAQASLNGHASIPKASYSNNTILIAEDDDVSFALMKSYLKASGLTILRAVNGRECIDIIKSNPGIRLVLMDIKMPEIDGYEATRLIRQINKHLPVIAQTANALEGDRDMALAAGCNDYLTKPVSKETLLGIMEMYVKKSIKV